LVTGRYNYCLESVLKAGISIRTTRCRLVRPSSSPSATLTSAKPRWRLLIVPDILGVPNAVEFSRLEESPDASFHKIMHLQVVDGVGLCPKAAFVSFLPMRDAPVEAISDKCFSALTRECMLLSAPLAPVTQMPRLKFRKMPNLGSLNDR
jgi:hypothetical protein